MASSSSAGNMAATSPQVPHDRFTGTIVEHYINYPKLLQLAVHSLGVNPRTLSAPVRELHDLRNAENTAFPASPLPAKRPDIKLEDGMDVDEMGDVDMDSPEQRILMSRADCVVPIDMYQPRGLMQRRIPEAERDHTLFQEAINSLMKPGQTANLNARFAIYEKRWAPTQKRRLSEPIVFLNDAAASRENGLEEGLVGISAVPQISEIMYSNTRWSTEKFELDVLGFTFPTYPSGYLQGIAQILATQEEHSSFSVDVEILLGRPRDPEEASTSFTLTYRFNIYTNEERLTRPLPSKELGLCRYIFHEMYPLAEPIEVAQEYVVPTTSLQDFYASLRPANPYPARLEEILTPPGLTASLRPYQKRTVAFLLQMEDAGEIDPYFATPNHRDPTGIWERITIGSGDQSFSVGFARCTGDVRSIDPQAEEEYNRVIKGKGKAYTEGAEGEAGARADNSIPWLRLSNGLTTGRDLGVMLCEEMGLGKTVEAIALMLLHPRMGPFKTSYNEYTQMQMTEVATNLVITPGILFDQWRSEIKTHAPELKVMVYRGWKKHFSDYLQKHPPKPKPVVRTGTKRRQADRDSEDPTESEVGESAVMLVIEDFVKEVQKHDIVLSTFNDVAGDFAVSVAPPKRSRRSNVVHNVLERPRCFLQAVEWARIIQDECQLVSQNQAVTVARIPRKFSIAMSGTPAKEALADCKVSLDFIGLGMSAKLWKSLQLSAFQPALTGLLSSCLVRTIKRDVAQEAGLQNQRRFLIPLTLNRVELDYYRDCLEKGGEALGLMVNGEISDRADADILRALVHDLREICLHIQVGSLGRTKAVNGKNGKKSDKGRRLNFGSKLLTLKEASEHMFLEARLQVWLLQRNLLTARLAKGVLTQHQVKEEVDRPAQYLLAEMMLKDIYSEAERSLADVTAAYRALFPAGTIDFSDSDTDSDSEDSEDGEESPDKAQDSRELKGRKMSYRSQIREFRMLQHAVKFRIGDLYYGLRENVDVAHPLETESYESATALRTVLLKNALRATERGAEQVNSVVGASDIGNFRKLEINELDLRGILTYRLRDEANETIEALNVNLSERIWPWRGEIARLLTSAVAPDDATGEDYDAGLDTAVKLHSFLNAWTDALTDHKDMIDIEREVLVSRNAAEEKQRKAQADRAKRRAKGIDVIEVAAFKAPGRTKDAFEQMVEQHADSLRPAKTAVQTAFEGGRSLNGLLVELVELRNDNVMRPEELQIANSLYESLKEIRAKQKSFIALFEKELEVFRRAMNTRTSYLSSLQEISDSVSLFEDPWDKTAREVAEEREKLAKEAIDVDTILESSSAGTSTGSGSAVQPETNPVILQKKKAWRAKELFTASGDVQRLQLQHLRAAARLRFLGSINEKQADAEDICIVCREDFGSEDAMNVVLLACGHSFCESCYGSLRSHGSMRCIICRQEVVTSAIRRITYRIEEEVQVVVADDGAAKQITVNSAKLDPELFHVMKPSEDILEIDVYGDYGTKIDFLVRHLIYLRKNDRSVRHLVFCSWSDGLHIVQTALRSNGIKCISFDETKAAERFQKETDISVFLLHSERQSSGLNLTGASVVHMLNPMLNNSFELQAIGRVDRMGQERETTVYCYAAEDTIETKIVHRDLRRGSSIYSRVQGMNPMEQAPQGGMSMAKKRADDASGTDRELRELLMG